MRKYVLSVCSALTGEYLGSVPCYSLNFYKVISKPSVSDFVKRLFSEHEDYPVFNCYITTVRQHWIKKYVLLSKVGWSDFTVVPGTYLSVSNNGKFTYLEEVRP